MAQGSLFAFPAELMTLIKHRPNSSSIIRSAAAFDFPFLSACSAWARRQLHVASATSLVTNVNGNLQWFLRERWWWWWISAEVADIHLDNSVYIFMTQQAQWASQFVPWTQAHPRNFTFFKYNIWYKIHWPRQDYRVNWMM